jgi:aspartyl-tRNA(Asn)/glutamyl-tRNA(Gln) amidotransferase subunit C
MISKEEVLKIAKLARLELGDSEVEKMQKDLSSILEYFDILTSAPKLLKTVLDKPRLAGAQNTRQDIVLEQPKNVASDLMRLAPETEDGYVKVKQIL